MRKNIKHIELLKKASILYVEDDPDILRQLSHFLESFVLNLCVADDGQKGLEKYHKYKPDIVITDIKMPVMDGLEMAKLIKEVDQDVPIIVTTAHNEPDYLLKAIDLGIDKVVIKPTDPYVLLGVLSKSVFNINQKKELEIQQRYAHFISDANPSFMIIANENKLEYINKTFLDFLGYSSIYEYKAEQKRLDDFFCNIEGPNSSYKKGDNWLKYIIDYPDSDVLVHIGNGQGEENKVFLVTYSRFPERDKYIFTFTDITKIKKEKEELKKQTTIDVLTGVFNRKKLLDEFDASIQLSKRYKRPLSIIMFDVDFFKDINDSYGHGVGDKVLKEITSIVAEHIREPDFLIRWGGDEFMILIPESDLEEATQLARKLCLLIRKFHFSEVGEVTGSFGVVQLQESDDQDKFIKRADKALYKAKKNGRNRVESLDG